MGACQSNNNNTNDTNNNTTNDTNNNNTNDTNNNNNSNTNNNTTNDTNMSNNDNNNNMNKKASFNNDTMKKKDIEKNTKYGDEYYASYGYEANDYESYERYVVYDHKIMNESNYASYMSNFKDMNTNMNNDNVQQFDNINLKKLIYDWKEIQKDHDTIKKNFEEMLKSDYYYFYWNIKRQLIYDKNVEGPSDERERTKNLKTLNKDFEKYTTPIAIAIIYDKICEAVDKYDKIVTSEGKEMGGRAGGEKIVIGNVLFKFANNKNGIYTNEMSAQKAAALEIKAYNCIVDSGLHLINYAMTALIRYRGYCIVAIALLPINEANQGRLVYGSNNGAKTITIDKDAEKRMKELGEYCHVRAHKVIEKSTKKKKLVQLAVDIEGHMNDSGSFFILDVARLSSPTLITQNINRYDRSAFLTRHFRFELLRSARLSGLEALSSDAFSKFSVSEDYENDLKRCEAMMDFLLNHQIVKVVDKLLLFQKSSKDDTKEEINQSTHMRDSRQEYMSVSFKEYGINMRYIPSVAMKLHQQLSSSSSSDYNQEDKQKLNEWYEYLCEEMIIRYLKVHIRGGWNQMIGCSDVQLFNALCELLIEFGAKGEYNSWWDILLKELTIKYNDIEEATQYVLNKIKEIIYERNHYSLISRLLNALNIEYDSNNFNDVESIRLSSKTFSMKVLVKSVKAPEFLTLSEREQVLNAEIKWRISIGQSTITPLTHLLNLYRMWREEAPDISYERGDKVGKKLFSLMNIDYNKTDFNEEELNIDQKLITHEVAWSLYEMGAFYNHFSKYNLALICFKYDYKVSKLYFGTNDIDFSGPVNNIGMIYQSQGKYHDAMKYYKLSLDIKKRANATDDMIAQSLNNIASVSQSLGDYDSALRDFKKSLFLYKKCQGDDNINVGTCLINIASIKDMKGDYENSLSYYAEALQMIQRHLGENHRQVAQILNNIGLVYETQGKFDKSIEKYQHALRIYKVSIGEKNFDVADTLNNLGNVMNAQGNFDEAIKHFKDSIKIAEEVGQHSKHVKLVAPMVGVGNSLLSKDNYEECLKYYERAAEIIRFSIGEEFVDLATVINNIGYVQYKLQNYEKSLEYYEKSLNIYISSIGENHIFVARGYNNLGNLKVAEKKYSEALDIFDKSLRIAKNANVEKHIAEANILLNIGITKLLQDKNNISEAKDLFIESLNLRKAAGDSFVKIREKNQVGFVLCSFDLYQDTLKTLQLEN